MEGFIEVPSEKGLKERGAQLHGHRGKGQYQQGEGSGRGPAAAARPAGLGNSQAGQCGETSLSGL